MVNEILSCDWGTSSFRLRYVSLTSKEILSEVINDIGIIQVYNNWLLTDKDETERLDYYLNILEKQLQNFSAFDKNIPLIISGMASSSIGMKVLDYATLPFNIQSGNVPVLQIKSDKKFDRNIILVSGLKTNEDVMRGEETMLYGLDLPGEKVMVIMPGTHSKHVQVENNIIVDFKTYMSGEVFDLLANKSVLRQSVLKNDSEHYKDSFRYGVIEGAKGNLLNKVFHVRTNRLFQKQTPEANYHYLSGLITGAELKALTNEDTIHLISTKKFQALYLSAIETLLPEKKVNCYDADEALVNGHRRLAHVLL